MVSATELGSQQKCGFKLDLCSLNSESPILVLKGWYGCQDKYLSKYSDVVAKLGCSTLRTILPPAAVWHILPTARRAHAAKVMDFLLDSGLSPPRKVILYMFSNGACFVYQHMYELMEKSPRYAALKDQVAGCIFDSCPAYMTPGGGRHAFLMPFPPYLRLLMTLVFHVYAAVSRLLNRNFAADFWQHMTTFDLGVPQLYLYSDDDNLTDGLRLEALINTKISRGTEIYSKRWQVSEHVGHLRLHREEYTAQLTDFLSHCLRKT